MAGALVTEIAMGLSDVQGCLAPPQLFAVSAKTPRVDPNATELEWELERGV